MSAKVFVGNLNFRTNRDDLATFLSDVGTVVDVFFPIDRATGRPRGFAFVEFASETEATSAIERKNGQMLDGRALNLNAAHERPPRVPRPPLAPAGVDPGALFAERSQRQPPRPARTQAESLRSSRRRSLTLGGRRRRGHADPAHRQVPDAVLFVLRPDRGESRLGIEAREPGLGIEEDGSLADRCERRRQQLTADAAAAPGGRHHDPAEHHLAGLRVPASVGREPAAIASEEMTGGGIASVRVAEDALLFDDEDLGAQASAS